VLAGSPTVAGLADALRTGSPSVQSSLVVLRSVGDRAPLVLVHGNTGNLLHYAGLVPLLDRDRPVWGLEHMATDDLSVGGIASSHVRSLMREDLSGPFLVVGFCYGAVIAHEIACQLRAEGHEVSLLALLGVTPLEFPTLLPSSARDRWRLKKDQASTLFSQTRHHLENAWAMPARERPRYLAMRGVNVLSRSWGRVGRRDSRSSSLHETLQRALATHRPATYPGSALLVLHKDETAFYTDDPGHEWSALAEHIDLEVLPGAEHAMLEEPGVGRLAELIHDRLSSIP
jgi:thioesterase domain-containing protein